MAPGSGVPALHVEAEETLTVSQYSLSEPHAFIVPGKDGSMGITVAGGAAETLGEY